MSSASPILRVQPILPLGRDETSPGLVVGQRLHGVVLRTGAGQADLLLGGRMLPVRTDLSLVPGTPLRLEVREVTAASIALGVLPSASDAEGGVRHLATEDLRELASTLRLPTNERTLAILRELMANGRPLTAEAVRQVLVAARAADQGNALPLRPLVWLLAQGLPVTPATLALAGAALPEDAPLPLATAPGALPALQLAERARHTDAVLAQVSAGLPAPVRAPLLDLRAALAHLGLTSQPPASVSAAALAQQLSGLAEQAATPIEAKLARLVSPALPAQPGLPPPPATRSPAPLVGPARPTIDQEPEGAGAGVPTRPATAGAAPAEPAALSMDMPVPSATTGSSWRGGDLRLLIDRAMAAMQAPAAAGATARHPVLAETLTNLAASVDFAQLANAAGATPGDGRQTVWLPLPLPPGPAGQPPLLSITTWEGSAETVAPRHLRATLTLTLQHLGDLTIHLDVIGQHLRCDVRAAEPSVATIQPLLGDLTNRLVRLGYTVEAAAVTADFVSASGLTAPPLRRLDQVI